MTNSAVKSKQFFAKSVLCGIQDTMTIIGFADDPLESTQFLTASSFRSKSAPLEHNYTVKVDSDECNAQNAFETLQLTTTSLEVTFTKSARQKLGYASANITFKELSPKRLEEIKNILAAITGMRLDD